MPTIFRVEFVIKVTALRMQLQELAACVLAQARGPGLALLIPVNINSHYGAPVKI